jgi:hypothetical protein
MHLVTEITSFLAGLGFDRPIAGFQPLVQWERPTAFRVIFEFGTSPRSIIVKHVPGFENCSVSEQWRPRWKVAQDYVNLCFLQEVDAGAFAPRVYGYSEKQNMLAIEDLGRTCLRDIRDIPEIGTNRDLWQEVASVLGRLVNSCPRDPAQFVKFAQAQLPTFAPLRKWEDQNPADCHSIVGVAREMSFGSIADLEDEVARLVRLATQADRWIGYSVGDLWHQHVMFHNGRPKFIDFHCGGYDIAVTDLMRLIEGTPLYQGSPLPSEIVTTCKDAFFAELCSAKGRKVNRQEFEEVYDFTLLRHVAFMVGREIIELRRKHQCELVTNAVRAALQHLSASEHTRAITVDFVTELEKFPNNRMHTDAR